MIRLIPWALLAVIAVSAPAVGAEEPGEEQATSTEAPASTASDIGREGPERFDVAQEGMPFAAPAGDPASGAAAVPTEGLPEEEPLSEAATIADPLEPWNRLMFHFNDRLYYWLLKPVAQGYSYVTPEPVRVSIRNFFNNATTPIRFVNCVLQGKMTDAGTEGARFGINTFLGFGGFFDTAQTEFDIALKNEDLGQTLGRYGMDGLMYIVWPFLGPSTVRDTIGIAGDSFLNPLTFVDDWGIRAGVQGFNQVNRTSLAIGEYEDLVEAAVEPYIAVRDSYVDYRKKKINE